MPKTTRRSFIRGAGLGAVGISVLDATSLARGATQRAGRIPKHLALLVPGVHAYPMEHSLAAGETLQLCVSASVPYSMSICRLGLNVDDPSGDTILAKFPNQ